MGGGKTRKYMELAKGFRGKAKNCKRIVYDRVDKALEHSYVNRKLRKRDMRKLWITQVNAGVREYDMSYSVFINKLNTAEIGLNRKVLADMAQHEPLSFRAIIEICKNTPTNNVPVAARPGLTLSTSYSS